MSIWTHSWMDESGTAQAVISSHSFQAPVSRSEFLSEMSSHGLTFGTGNSSFSSGTNTISANEFPIIIGGNYAIAVGGQFAGKPLCQQEIQVSTDLVYWWTEFTHISPVGVPVNVTLQIPQDGSTSRFVRVKVSPSPF